MDWQDSFALPDSSRQQASRLTRLRHRQCSSSFGDADHNKRAKEAVLDSSASAGRTRRNCRVITAASASRTKVAEKIKAVSASKTTVAEKVTAASASRTKETKKITAASASRTEETKKISAASAFRTTKEANKVTHSIKSHSDDSIVQLRQRDQNLNKIENVPGAVVFQDGNLPALLSAEFFKCSALELAPKLLGKFLRRDDVVLQITEVEAYCPNDSACHGRFGITARTAPVFGPAGHAYVYLCYGLHNMLNIVADMEGIGAAVLIRSCAPVAGLKTIQFRRGMTSIKPELLSGPGKIGQALGLTAEWSNHPLYMPGGLEILDGPSPKDILVGPRVGIDYANSEDVAAPWRFAISGTPWISAPKNTLKPA